MFRKSAKFAAAAALLAGVACGKTEPPKPPVAADKAGAAGVGLPGPATATAANVDKAKLAKDFATIRCQIIGYAAPLPKIYTDLGYGSAHEFADTFAAAAKLDRDWARAAVAAAYAQPCPGGKPALGPGAATPTGAEAGGGAGGDAGAGSGSGAAPAPNAGSGK